MAVDRVKGKNFSRKYTNDSCLFAQWFKAHPLQSSTGFTEGLSRHLVLNLILKPGEKKSVKVKFTPVHNRTVSSLIIIRYVLWFKCGLTSSAYMSPFLICFNINICINLFMRQGIHCVQNMHTDAYHASWNLTLWLYF